MLIDLYCSLPQYTCFDGDPDPNAGDPNAGDPDPNAGDPNAGDPDPNAGDKTFSQEELNKILAEDKRKHKTQLQKVEQQYETLLKSSQLSQQERASLEESLEDVRKQMRTKEEQAKIEKKALQDKFTAEIDVLKVRAESAERKYTESTINRSLQDAAVVGDAFSPSQVVTLLRPLVKMVDDSPMVDFPDISSETGEDIIKQMTPAEAIARMKQLPEQFGNLFKSGVVGGIGAGSTTGGVQPGQNGRVDIRKIRNMDQYLEIRKNNPNALGLNK